MAKSSKYLIPAALAIITLTGCGNEGNEPNPGARKDAPDFTATIGNAQSRAFDTSWDREDAIGVTGCGRTNVAYITSNADGKFTVATQVEPIYFQDDNEATFTAYYPWKQLSAEVQTISADTREQAQQKNFDFLWATASGRKDKPNVDFNFAHRMAKVVITVKTGDAMSFDEAKATQLSLKGLRYKGMFNISSGTTTVDNDSDVWTFSGFATANDAEKTLTFSFVLFPQEFATSLDFLAELQLQDGKTLSLSAPLSFTSANSEKDGAQAKNEWVAGRQYNLSVTLHKTAITVNECVINPWNKVDVGNINVD